MQLQRSKSFCQADIDKVLDRNDGTAELIGDFSKVSNSQNPIAVRQHLRFDAIF